MYKSRHSQDVRPHFDAVQVYEGHAFESGDPVAGLVVLGEVVGVPGEQQDGVHVHLVRVTRPARKKRQQVRKHCFFHFYFSFFFELFTLFFFLSFPPSGQGHQTFQEQATHF